MHDRKVMRLEGEALVEHADLHGVATWHCNDMVVDGAGRAYVSNFGSGAPPGEPITPGKIARVDPDGRVSAAADGMGFANGMAITPDGKTFLVAETRSEPPRITAFDLGRRWHAVEPSLRLRFRRRRSGRHLPRCRGRDLGRVPFTNEALRVLYGRIVHRVSTGDQGCYAVALGGSDGRTLFICTSGSWIPEEARELRNGRVCTLRVDVPAP